MLPVRCCLAVMLWSLRAALGVTMLVALLLQAFWCCQKICEERSWTNGHGVEESHLLCHCFR